MQTATVAHCPLPEKGISNHQMRLPFQEAIKSDPPQHQHKFTIPVLPEWIDYFFHCLGHHFHNCKSEKKPLVLKVLIILMHILMAYGPWRGGRWNDLENNLSSDTVLPIAQTFSVF